MNTFNAEQLSTTISIVEDMAEGSEIAVGHVVGNLSTRLNEFSEIVKSEDSNLAATCVNLANTFSGIKSKLISVCNSIVTEITNYAKETLANESGATQSLEEINGNLESINSALASL